MIITLKVAQKGDIQHHEAMTREDKLRSLSIVYTVSVNKIVEGGSLPSNLFSSKPGHRIPLPPKQSHPGWFDNDSSKEVAAPSEPPQLSDRCYFLMP